MSTGGHSTIDRIVSATLEKRRERYRSSSVPCRFSPVLSSLSPALPDTRRSLPPLFLSLSLSLSSAPSALARFLFSLLVRAAHSSRLSIDFPPLSLPIVHHAALPPIDLLRFFRRWSLPGSLSSLVFLDASSARSSSSLIRCLFVTPSKESVSEASHLDSPPEISDSLTSRSTLRVPT